MFPPVYFPPRYFPRRYFPTGATPSASRQIQEINFVIHQSYNALLGSDLGDGSGGGGSGGAGVAGAGAFVNDDEDSGEPWVDDWSTTDPWEPDAEGEPGPDRPVTPDDMVRRIRPGGSGVRITRRRPAPVFRVTVTADDQAKEYHTVFTWAGTEFAASGVQSPDAIQAVQFRSLGAAFRAPVGTYPIYPGRIRFTGPVRSRYSVRYVPGTMTVSQGGGSPIAFVRKDDAIFHNAASVDPEWTMAAQPGNQNLLVVHVFTSGNGAPAAPSAVTNATGNPFHQNGNTGYVAGTEGFLDGYPVMVSQWYRICDAGSDDQVVKVTYGGGVGKFCDLVALEYSGASAGSPQNDISSVSVQAVNPTLALTVPAVSLNGSTGQMIVAAYTMSRSRGTPYSVTAGYNVRYGPGVYTGNQVQSIFILDRLNLSGAAAQSPTITLEETSPGTPPPVGYGAICSSWKA